MTGQQHSVQVHDGEGAYTMRRTLDAIFSPVVMTAHALRRKFVNGITQPQETLDNAPQVHAPYRNATQALASYCEPAFTRIAEVDRACAYKMGLAGPNEIDQNGGQIQTSNLAALQRLVRSASQTL